jgi:adenylate cyclase
MENIARNAVLAALEMLRRCDTLNRKFTARGWPTLKIGVGVNSGNVRVGDMGSKQRRAYTAMGDAVNVASRLEGRTKHYGVGILVGEATRNLVKDVVFREIDKIKVKGKDEAITIHEPTAWKTRSKKKFWTSSLWHQTLRLYRSASGIRWKPPPQSAPNESGLRSLRVVCEEASAEAPNPPPAE